MPKCDFNKVALQLYWNHTSAWVFSCKFAAYFQNTFPKNTSGGLLLKKKISQVPYGIRYKAKVSSVCQQHLRLFQ